MDKNTLLTGMELKDVVSAIETIKPGTFGHTIEIRTGEPMETEDGTVFVCTSVIPVRFHIKYSNMKLAKLSDEIYQCISPSVLTELDEKVKALRPEERERFSNRALSILETKKRLVTAGRLLSATPKSKHTVNFDPDYPYVSYALSGKAQISCCTSFQKNTNVKNKFYVITGDEVEEIRPETKDEKDTIKEAISKMRVAMGKKPTSKPSIFLRPTIDHIVAIK